VARGFSGDTRHLADLFAGAIAHRGFALVDVFSPCVTFNKVNTYAWFKKRVYNLDDEAGYDPEDAQAALAKAFEWGDRIPLGLIYRSQQPTYEDSEPVLRRGAPAVQPLGVDASLFQEMLAETM